MKQGYENIYMKPALIGINIYQDKRETTIAN